jgi:aryl-alcohol dehydrogenase-like predicted oxidoreductase
MNYTIFNKYKVSKLSLGTVQLGMDYGIANQGGAPSFSEGMALLNTCTLGGINSFDTSPTYGTSEDVLGSYFSGIDREGLFVVSKFKYNPDQVSDMDQLWNEVQDIVRQSLTRLGLSKLPLLLYHKGPSESMVQVNKIVPVLLDRLKNEGLIDHGGISLYYSSEASDLVNDRSFEALQIPLNVLDQAIVGNGTLETLHKKGKLIMVRSVFLQGLFWKDPADLSGKLPEAAPYLNMIRQLAVKYDLTVAELVFGFIRDLPEVDSLVIGAENLAQIEANLSLIAAPVLSPELRAELRKLSADVPLKLITPALWF